MGTKGEAHARGFVGIEAKCYSVQAWGYLCLFFGETLPPPKTDGFTNGYENLNS